MNYILKSDYQHTIVHETQTDQPIYKCESYEKAKEYQRSLNFGSGFDGWTPSYILNSVKNVNTHG